MNMDLKFATDLEAIDPFEFEDEGGQGSMNVVDLGDDPTDEATR